MNQDKMYLINKIFKNDTIRTVWNKEEEKYFISVVDIVSVITESENPRKYWSVLKTRLKKEGNELATNCSQLKLKASDGKNMKLAFNNKEIYNDKMQNPMVFKIEYDDKSRITNIFYLQ